MDHSWSKLLNSCRICMLENAETTLFEMSQVDHETNLTSEEKFSYCLPEIDFSLIPNPLICKECNDAINFIYSFKKKCFQMQMRIHNHQVQLKFEVDDEVPQLSPLESTEQKVEPMLDAVSTEDLDEDQKHLQELVLPSQSSCKLPASNYIACNYYQCSYCTYWTSYKALFNVHKRIHLTKNHYKYILKGQKVNRSKRCKFVLYQSGQNNNTQDLDATSNCSERKAGIPPTKEFTCLQCGFATKYKHYLKVHAFIHTGEKPFSCSLCDYRSNVKGNLRMHNLRIHNIINASRYHCSVKHCNYSSKNKTALRRHMNSHTSSKKLHKCTICTRGYSQKWNLTKHMRIHLQNSRKIAQITNDKKCFQCPFCEFKSNYIHSVDAHVGKKPFDCRFCDYKSRCKGDKKKHMNSHTSKRPVRHTSNRLSNVIHSDEKFFQCSICNYGTRFKDNLKRHMGVHADGKPFCCFFCNYKSTSARELKIHMRIHADKFFFDCLFCEYKSECKFELKEHIMQIHLNA